MPDKSLPKARVNNCPSCKLNLEIGELYCSLSKEGKRLAYKFLQFLLNEVN